MHVSAQACGASSHAGKHKEYVFLILSVGITISTTPNNISEEVKSSNHALRTLLLSLNPDLHQNDDTPSEECGTDWVF